MFKIERIFNQKDPRLTQFREEIFIENHAKKNYINLNLNYKETQQYYDTLGEDAVFEEIWKFGNTKWNQTHFSCIETAVNIEDNTIMSISGCRKYTHNMLRVAMHLYTLSDFRKSCRNLQFAEQGFFYKHIEYAKKIKDIDCLFMTVYPHTNKLKAHFKNLAYRRLSIGPKMHFIHDLVPIDNPIKFHNVEQYFLLYPLNPSFEWTGPPEPLDLT